MNADVTTSLVRQQRFQRLGVLKQFSVALEAGWSKISLLCDINHWIQKSAICNEPITELKINTEHGPIISRQVCSVSKPGLESSQPKSFAEQDSR